MKDRLAKAKFKATIKRCKETVATWPEWMQRIVITAETASTGKFIRPTNKGTL